MKRFPIRIAATLWWTNLMFLSQYWTFWMTSESPTNTFEVSISNYLLITLLNWVLVPLLLSTIFYNFTI